MPDVYITGRDGEEILMRTIPEGQHDAYTVAAEMEQVAQAAFRLGQLAEGTVLETRLKAVINQVRRETKNL